MTAPVPFELTATPGQITSLTIDGKAVEVDAVRYEQANGQIGVLTIMQAAGAVRIDGTAFVAEAADRTEVLLDFLTGINAEQLAAAALDTLTGQTLAARILELLIEAAAEP